MGKEDGSVSKHFSCRSYLLILSRSSNNICFILILFCEKYPPGGLTEKKNICYTVPRVN